MKKNILLSIALIFLALPVYGQGILVSWDANSEEDLMGYKVYFGHSTGVYSIPIDVGNVTSYQIPNVPEAVPYFVVVTAYDVAGNESGFSQEAFIETPDIVPATPGAPTVTVGTKSLVLNWASISGAVGYKVYVGTVSKAYGTPIDVGNVTSYTISNLEDSKTYYTAITAYDNSEGNTESGMSAEVTGTTNDTTPPNPPSKPNLSIWDKIIGWMKKIFHIG